MSGNIVRYEFVDLERIGPTPAAERGNYECLSAECQWNEGVTCRWDSYETPVLIIEGRCIHYAATKEPDSDKQVGGPDEL
jgi:hypothetical protein